MSRNINEEFYGDKSFSYGGKYRLYEEFDKDKGGFQTDSKSCSSRVQPLSIRSL